METGEIEEENKEMQDKTKAEGEMAGKKKYRKEDTKEGRQKKEGDDNGREEMEISNRWECLREVNGREEEGKIREKGSTEKRHHKGKMDNKPEEGRESDAMRKAEEVVINRNAIQGETQSEWERNEYKEIFKKKKRKESNVGNEGENNKKARGRVEDENTEGKEEARTGEEDNWVRKNTNHYDQETGNKKTCDEYEWDSHRDEYLITVVLNKEQTKTSKKANLFKIYKLLMDTGIKFQSLKMVGFNRAEVTYNNRQEANNMLRNQLKPCDYGAYIPGRWKYRKCVINEWEDSIQELEDQLMPNQGVFTLERLKHRRMKDGKAVWEEGKAILLKMQGDSLPTRVLIGYGHVCLNVKPYVEAVKQCFKCLRFGHIQTVCRAPDRKCFICTKVYHGRCTENPRCYNCKGESREHRKRVPSLSKGSGD